MSDPEEARCQKRMTSRTDTKWNNKLVAVLQKALQPNFKTADNTVLPKLMDLIRIQGKSNNVDQKVLSQMLHDWLEKACSSWSCICEAAKVFALKVGAHLAAFPAGLARLSSSGCLTVLLSQGTATSDDQRCGYICLLESLTSEAEGLHLLLHSGVWKNVVKIVLSSSNIYCFQQSTKLIAALLMEGEEKISFEIFNEIVGACENPSHIRVSSPTQEPAGNVQQIAPSSDDAIIKTSNACRKIILGMMDREYPVDRINAIIESSDFSSWAWTLINNNSSKRVTDAVNKLACVLNALHFYQCRDEAGFIPFDASSNIMDVILNHIELLKTLRMYHEVLDACADYQIYLHKYGALVAPGKDSDSQGRTISDVTFCLHNAVVCFLVIAWIDAVRQCTEVDILEEYIDKLYRKTDSKVIRHAYSYRDALLVSFKEKLPILCMAILRKISCSSHIIKKEQALDMFQGIVHLVGEFVAKPEESAYIRCGYGFSIEEGDMLLAKYPAVLSAALNCLHSFLEKFDFSWRDSLESLSLMSSLQKLLDSTLITQRITVEALNVVDLVLKKFMPPNLALLVDSIKDSSIEQLGPQLFKLLHSTDWAVRDSALEVVKTICTLSESRYPAFQALLMDSGLPQLVLFMTETDLSPFVKTSAISCLCELAKVPGVWKATLSDINVVEKLLLILNSESEGIVRVAAAKTISVMHSRRSISSKDLELVYNGMAYTACNDLHWEVRVESLEFWRWVLIHSVIDQGMKWSLDFAEFVYDKEHKRIVKLTPKEISLRLSKTYKVLGDVGCLQVMYDTFINEADLVVQRKSAELHKMVSAVTKKWDVPRPAAKTTGTHRLLEPCKIVLPEPDNNEEMDVVISHQCNPFQDAEVHGLIRSSDSNANKPLPRFTRVVLSDEQFVNKMRNVDIERILHEKEKWIVNTSNGLVSLLDDMLLFMGIVDGESQANIENTMGCY